MMTDRGEIGGDSEFTRRRVNSPIFVLEGTTNQRRRSKSKKSRNKRSSQDNGRKEGGDEEKEEEEKVASWRSFTSSTPERSSGRQSGRQSCKAGGKGKRHKSHEGTENFREIRNPIYKEFGTSDSDCEFKPETIEYRF